MSRNSISIFRRIAIRQVYTPSVGAQYDRMRNLSDQLLPALVPAGNVGAICPFPGFFFSFFAQRKPHALHKVFGPVGPFRHSGESSVPVKD